MAPRWPVWPPGARSASGQTAADLRSKGTSKELIAYGERSRFVTSIRDARGRETFAR